jgi:hypothetical protein
MGHALRQRDLRLSISNLQLKGGKPDTKREMGLAQAPLPQGEVGRRPGEGPVPNAAISNRFSI